MSNNPNFNEKTDFFSWKDYNILDYAIIFSTFLSFFIISIFHYLSVVTVVASLLYIPIILFAYRYPGKGILFAIIISASYLIIFEIMIEPVFGSYADAVGRTLIFIIVGVVASFISKQMHSEKSRYLDLFNNFSDPVFVSEADSAGGAGHITDCNFIAGDLLGYKKEELLKMFLFDLVVPGDREKIISTGKNQGYYSPDLSVVMMTKKDGTKVPFELSSYSYETGKKTVHVTIAHNIEKRLEGEKKVFESSWKLKESQKIAHLGYWEMNLKTGIQSWSDETFRIFKIPPTPDMTVDISDFKRFEPSDFHEIFLEEYGRSVKEKKDFSMKYRIIREDGEERWVHFRCHHYKDRTGEIVRSLGTVLDITKYAEAGVKTAEKVRFYEILIETIPLPIFHKDRNGIYLGCNQAFANFFGKKKDQIIGKSVSEVLDERSAALAAERDNLMLEISGIQVYEAELLDKNRNLRNMIVSKAAIKDKKGEPDLILGVMQDITDIKKAKQNLKKSLEEKNILLQEIHHRVKNNLAVISGILEIEKSRIKDKDALIFLNEAENRIQSMVIVHESLYHSENFAGMDAGEHFRNLFESVLISYSPNADISLDLKTSGCIIDINSAIPCSLVVNEILTNSMKYAFTGMDKGMIAIEMHCAGDEYILTVSDNGRGIPKDITPDKSPTLGMKVILNIVRLQLLGNISLLRDNGTKWVIKWPKKSTK